MVNNHGVLFCFLFLFVLVTSIIFVVTPSSHEEIKFVTSLVVGAAVICSAYYVGASLRLQVVNNMQKASFELLNMINTKAFVTDRSLIEKKIEWPQEITDNELYEQINNDPVLDAAVVSVTGVLEDMSIAIQSGFVDEIILYRSMRSIVLFYWARLRGWIIQTRNIRNTESLLVEFEKLATTWEMRRSLICNKKFDLPDK